MFAHVRISGRVQGVGFRFTAKLAALEYGLTGWVKNKMDGTVEMEVTGEKESVEAYLDSVQAGLNASIQVEHMEIEKKRRFIKRIFYFFH
ncbi:acylphosphatase [Virgibacillus halophilus]|uniref:Acylphosphatase n=1 Tax=Tigheibacillus halophilus TaxID=361280 RepID=A0ABU5CBC8_9BACI|nr:acylphosphatase [Virgibacillus halophilus]